jgi:ubiquinone/menaquinone biosynthesis C-methylase UbiE
MGIEALRQENKVSEAFSRQSVSFDDIYENNPITLLMRDKTRREVLKYIQPGAKILELNCGTGIDTIFFARHGFEILATDNADGMLQRLSEKIKGEDFRDRISLQKCSFNDLSHIGHLQFDYLFSNFAGLNCTDDLARVLKDADKLLKPGGYFTFVIMPKICPWEIAMLLRGRVKLALRRLRKNGADAHIEGVYFSCYYYDPSYVIKNIGRDYTLCSLTGLAALVPPPSMEYFPWKYPGLFNFLNKIENKVCNKFPFNRCCDQYIITMRKANT